MSYAAGESGALGILRGSTYFDAANSVSLANDSPEGGYGRLDSGAAAVYAFLRPGGFERRFSTLVSVTTTWTAEIELWVRYADPSAYQTLAAVCQSVLEAFDPYTALNGASGAARSFIHMGGPVEAARAPGGGARYLCQRLALTWDETYTPTLAD